MNSPYFKKSISFTATSLLFASAVSLLAPSAYAADTITAGNQFGAAVSGNEINTWGLNSVGQLGQGTTGGDNPTPTRINSTLSYAKAEAGPNFAFGITSGDGDVTAWGDNSFGQLGTGNTTNLSTPASVIFPGDVAIADIAAGTDHALALSESGALYAWGSIAVGQLGLGVFQDPVPEDFNDTVVETPQRVGTSTWLDIGAGNQFSVAVRNDGKLFIWGGGALGTLGLTSQYLSPVEVPGSQGITWAQVEAGYAHVIALTANGEIYTWGINATGQLGLGDTISRTAPTRVGAASNWTYISTGSYQTYAINSSGELYAFGLNSSEQLGQEVTLNPGAGLPINYMVLTPMLAMQGVAEAVDGGRDNPGEVGTLPDGTEVTGFSILTGTPLSATSVGIYTIGGNYSGQLGTGVKSFTTSPIPVRTSADGASIEVGVPSIDADVLGVNSRQEISVSVANTGSVNITEDYTVTLYLSPTATYNSSTSGDPIASKAVDADLAIGDSENVPFSDVLIPVKVSGSYYLIARAVFANENAENAPDTSIGVKPVTLVRPDIKLQNLNFANGTTIDLGQDFTDVSVELTNGTIGIIPDGRDINIQAFLLSNLDFDPVSDVIPEGSPQLIPTSDLLYSDGLNAFNAPTDADPPVTVSLDFSTLDVPETQNSREYFLIVFVVNRADPDSEYVVIGEEDGVTENNYITQRVRIVSPNSVAPAIGFGDLMGQNLDIGKPGEWSYVSDQFALNGDALQSPDLAASGTASMSLPVYGPTTITAPWLLNAGGNATLEYTLKDAGGVDIAFAGAAPMLSSYQPNYQPVEIVVDQDSPLYVNGTNHPYPWTITWTFTQSPSSTTGYARVDLEAPNFVPDSNSFVFLGIDDESSPLGDGRVVSIDLNQSNMEAGQSAVMNLTYDFTRPSLVKFWWRTNGDTNLDTLSFSVDGEVQTLPTKEYAVDASNASISGNTGWQQVAFIVSGGPHTMRWNFTKLSDNPDANAFIDGLQILDPLPDTNEFNRSNPDPSLLANVTNSGAWVSIPDTSAPNELTYEVSGLAQGTSQSFSYDLADQGTMNTGPVVIYAPWLISSTTDEDDADADALSYRLFDAGNNPIMAAGSTPTNPIAFEVELKGGVNGYQMVNIVIDENSELYDGGAYAYPWRIEWTYEQNSADANAFARVAPTPYNFQYIPVSNVDMSIQSVVVTPGTYILDDANGTGRLPVSVSVINRGANFNVGPPNSTTNDFLDPTNLSVHLSLDQIFGNEDDVDLGNFAQSNVLNNGNQIIFQANLNLPFTTPAGNYFVLLQFDASTTVGEFTLSNNTSTQGPGFIIVRAPNLVIRNERTLSSTYPYHPEQPAYITYDITNIGLGTITESDTFSVQLGLYARLKTSDEFTNELPIKIYEPVEQSLFLPEVSAQYPNGGTTSIIHQFDLPTVLEVLVGIGAVNADEPEDSNEIYENLYEMNKYYYYFIATVDINDDILESSETNTFFFNTDFNIVPVPYGIVNAQGQVAFAFFENFGLYTGQPAFSDYVIVAPGDDSLTDPNVSLLPGFPNQTSFMSYALGLNPTPSPAGQELPVLYRPDYSNGLLSYDVEPFGDDEFLVMSFDFNTRASDFRIDVQAGDDPNNLSTITTISPPYNEIQGERSLTGFNGLLYDPLVMAVEGNVSSVQQVYTARVTVRDEVPYNGSRFMRLLITPTSQAPTGDPTNLLGSLFYFDGEFQHVVLNWTGPQVYSESNAALNGAYHIERQTGNDDAEIIAVVLYASSNGNFRFEDDTASPGNTYTYRVRAVSTGGTSNYSNDAVVSVPTN
ncbi:hypothetical protein [Cerasicoccus fimbriatus]|uniref:RCC1 domain-containing protein n=1 Tax=Cerasicoccus fimbriatus TaxID=3014554 RepID=UPI0022B48373|nr:hypothetical protein [Cerasicoccus sp. TK19100]